MREQDKIDEAEFFLAEMPAREQDPLAYRYMTSAFLSAARSVLQYAYEEAAKPDHTKKWHPATDAKGKAWYDAHMAASALLRYFKDKRDANVHQEPIPLGHGITIQPQPASVRATVLAPIVLVGGVPAGPLPPPAAPSAPASSSAPAAVVTYRYVFDDRKYPDDVPTLCRRYLDGLRAVVADGQRNSHLTP